MHSIHFLTSRSSDHPAETMTSAPGLAEAIADAQFAGVKARNPSVIGFIVRDNDGKEAMRWYAEAGHNA